MAAPNGQVALVAHDGDSINPPADIVIPPQSVRENIMKTAAFIHRKGAQGPAMEESIRKRNIEDPKNKFSYLMVDDSYYPYYAWYLQQLHEGKGPAMGNQAQAAASKPKGPAKPAEFRFSARMPNVSAKDLEVVKLTALYAAKNGENWLKELRNREAGNFQFDFLRPTHSLFGFFRALIDQYRILLEEEATVQARTEELQHNLEDRFHLLEKAKQRAEYVKYISHQKEQEEKKQEDEKREYQQIDWHDFSIIATVEFDEADDAVDLPAPTSLNDLQSASLEQKAHMSLSRRIEEAAPDEETYYNASAPNAYQTYPSPNANAMAPPVQPVQPVQPVYQPPPMPAQEYRQTARQEEEQRMQRERERAQAAAKVAPGAMRIRNDYVPRAVAKKVAVQMVLCPNCQQQVPANEYDEHVRIELLDPKWKEQREKSEARYATTINTVDVANNLKRFASQRDDIYDGVTGMPISEEEAARRKKAALSYDGQPDSAKDAGRIADMQNSVVQDQLRRIKEKHGGK